MPNELIEFFAKNRDTSYVPVIDESKPIDEQNLDKVTMALVTILKLDYWCKTEEEKSELVKVLNNNDEELFQLLASATSTRDFLKKLRS